PLGRAAMARRLLTGSLDRAVDVAATLELRGYSLTRSDAARGGVLGRSDRATHENVRSPHRPPCVLPPLGRVRVRGRFKSRYDARFYTVGMALLLAAIAGQFLGADGFSAYPTIEVGVEPATIALSVLVALAGFAPWRRNA
ncbi:MAG: hypothetical protein WA687_06700, partial [Solirubrobacterales bacterium]